MERELSVTNIKKKKKVKRGIVPSQSVTNIHVLNIWPEIHLQRSSHTKRRLRKAAQSSIFVIDRIVRIVPQQIM